MLFTLLVVSFIVAAVCVGSRPKLEGKTRIRAPFRFHLLTASSASDIVAFFAADGEDILLTLPESVLSAHAGAFPLEAFHRIVRDAVNVGVKIMCDFSQLACLVETVVDIFDQNKLQCEHAPMPLLEGSCGWNQVFKRILLLIGMICWRTRLVGFVQ